MVLQSRSYFGVAHQYGDGLQRLNQGFLKFFPIVKGQCLDSLAQGLEVTHFMAELLKSEVLLATSADGGLVPIQQVGYLSLIVPGFHEGVNLISFSLAETAGHEC